MKRLRRAASGWRALAGVKDSSPDALRLLEDTRQGAARPLTRHEAWAHGGLALAFLAMALALAVLVPWSHRLEPVPLVVLVAAYAAASTVRFDVAGGHSVPTQLVFFPMLLLLPAPLVPLCVAAGLLLAHLPANLKGTRHPSRALLDLWSAAHALGPALVIGLWAGTTTEIAQWHVYAIAFGAQVLADLLASIVCDVLILGVAPTLQLQALGWVYAVDALLTPVGVMAALASSRSPYAYLLVIPLLALLALFARDRRDRIDQAIELGKAYRGTALLLGELVEADDSYTGAHSRDVVELALSVSDGLGLDDRRRRNVEFGALLHDVGKIAVPKEIINKPGALDDAEWEIMKQHTVAGQRMLERVGGTLAEVGVVVRASHEEFDGSGYPDGLAAADIPIEARIISCCDAFSAMTTDRSYRKSLPFECAVAELRENAGRQFDPRVVEILLGVLGAGRLAPRGDRGPALHR